MTRRRHRGRDEGSRRERWRRSEEEDWERGSGVRRGCVCGCAAHDGERGEEERLQGRCGSSRGEARVRKGTVGPRPWA